ncbi:LANO_0E03356g1_1 [Lachancea nothofagi CBS 11611]|uniref:LANO_0E03356g1_1 n=1 Tax=Lachancea nothofagi CBS 11611 TaxID=1266666 RepID=A0A1G4JRF8_9SACH|nr:LANO_0E03356g1_1 [Lachancea nothofagi CBS 11611]
MTLEICPDLSHPQVLPSQSDGEAPKLPPLGKWNVQASSNATPLSSPTQKFPTTSRFKKAHEPVPSHSNSDQSTPHVQNQQKARLNAPFDITQIETRKLEWPTNSEPPQILKTDSGLQYTIQDGSVPCFKILRSQLPDPIAFYEQVEPVSSRYGAALLEIIEDSNLPSETNKSEEGSSSDGVTNLALNPDLFWFKARKQSLGSFEIERKKKLDLHRKLYHYHNKFRGEKKNPSLSKIPCIDKRPLDLYRLRQCVQLRGGFQTVCNKKLWAQIGRELGYSGRIMSSLSTSLRSAYSKVLADLDREDSENDVAGTVIEQDAPAKLQIILPSSTTDDPRTSGSKKRSKPGLPVICENRIKRHQPSQPKVYEVVGSSIEYPRLRDVLRYKGFFTNFESLTERKRHITRPSTSTLPCYSFSLWKNTSENYDKSAFESRDSPLYNLRQYYEKAQAHSKRTFEICNRRLPQATSTEEIMDIDKFEKLFFQLLSDTGSSCDVDTAINLPSYMHGSGFPTLSSLAEGVSERISDPWNLNNICLSEKSVLRYLDADYGSQLNTNLDIGMLFSVKGWSTEDNFLPGVDYHHVGSSKLWYVIPPQELEKFEKLIIESKNRKPSPSVSGTGNTEEKEFEESEFYQSFIDTTLEKSVSIHPRRINTHSICRSEMDQHMEFGYLADDLQFHPEVLKMYGIKFYKVIQNPKSYLFKFPKANTMSIQSGFGVSENARFAPSSWLDLAIDSELWLSKYGHLPGICSFQLLFNIVSGSDNKHLVAKARSILSGLITEELKARNAFARMLEDKFTVVTNTFDFISDLNLEPTGASKVLLTSPKDCLTLSLHQFLSNTLVKEGQLNVFGYDVANNGISVSLHLFYPTEVLESLVQDDQAHSDAAAVFSIDGASHNRCATSDILKSYEKLVTEDCKGRRVPFEKVSMYSEALSEMSSPITHYLKESVTVSRTLKSKCVELLEKVSKDRQDYRFLGFGTGFLIKDLPMPQFQYSVNELLILQQDLRCLSIDFPEMHKVFELCRLAQKFQIDAKFAIQKGNLELLRDIWVNGINLGVRSRFHKIVAKTVCEKAWLTIFDQAIAGNGNTSSEDHECFHTSDLPLFLRFGLRNVPESEHQDKFLEVQRIILLSQTTITKLKGLFKKKTSKIPIAKLGEVVKSMEQHPLLFDARLTAALKAILETFQGSKQKMASAFDKLEVNDHILSKIPARASGETLFDMQLTDKFDGSMSDHRLTLHEIPNKSIFTKHIRDCRTWLQLLNKLVPKKQSWAKILTSTNQCFQNKIDVWEPRPNSNDEKVYCFCRRGDFGSTMAACEICGEWYHMSCINKGKWTLGNSESSVFVCPICYSLDIPNTNVVDYSDLQALAMESCKLKIIPDRLMFSQFFEVFKIATLFRKCLRQSILKEDGTMRPEVSLSHVKFYLRKLLGSGVRLSQEVATLRSACRESDAQKFKSFSEKKINVVTGFEDLGIKEETPVVSEASSVILQDQKDTIQTPKHEESLTKMIHP